MDNGKTLQLLAIWTLYWISAYVLNQFGSIKFTHRFKHVEFNFHIQIKPIDRRNIALPITIWMLSLETSDTFDLLDIALGKHT